VTDLFTNSWARWSHCRSYRYLLARRWGLGPTVTYIMLNPSTADEVQNDPTVERCQRRAIADGFDGLNVVNLFAYRATDPAEMKKALDPVGQENGLHILAAALMSKRVVCAWGSHGNFNGRADEVLSLLRMVKVQPFCLGLNQDGQPKHPLYVGYEVKPRLMEVK